MGMTYMIGYDENRPKGEEWAEIDCNSTESAYIRSFIEAAVGERYPELYAKMEDEIYLEWFRFDELSQVEFMKVITAIRQFAKSGDYPEYHEYSVEAWNGWFEPLVVIDERYDPDYVLEK